jgi:hypothetical protein
VNIQLDVPPEIEAGLNSGDLIRYGSVIRDRLGIIVKHLKEVPEPAGSQEVATYVPARLSNPWFLVAATALGAATVGASAIIAARRRGQTGEGEEQEQAPSPQEAPVVYLRRHLRDQREALPEQLN